MNPSAIENVPTRQELIRGLLATRLRLEREGVIAVRSTTPAPLETSTSEHPLEQSEQAPATPAAAAPETSGVLMHPDVQQGLEQLLSEWDLFKSSGLFGLGAGGVDHPTYKKIAGQPVMAVESGRWEGADPKIVQEITSYMEGWKKEHGITADPEESFETYLRRVIARILNLDKA